MKCGRRLGRGKFHAKIVKAKYPSALVRVKDKKDSPFGLIEVEPWSKAAFRNEKFALEGVFYL